jgi:hypothetical protein
VEAPEVFEGLADRFGDAAPRLVLDPEDGDVLVGGGRRLGPPIGRNGIAGHYAQDPQTIAMIKRGYAGLRPGAIDPERITDQKLDGVDAEVLYPSVLFAIYRLDNPQILSAIFRNFNDWTANYASQAPNRLFPLACIPRHNVDDGIAELRRVKKPAGHAYETSEVVEGEAFFFPAQVEHSIANIGDSELQMLVYASKILPDSEGTE